MTTKVEIYHVRKDIDERHDISFMNYSYVKKVIPNLKKTLRTIMKKYMSMKKILVIALMRKS